MNFKKNWQLYVGGIGLATVTTVLIVRHIQHGIIVKKLDAKINTEGASQYGDSRDLDTASFWNISYGIGKPVSIYFEAAKPLAKKIYDSLGYFQFDKDADVIAVFNQLQYKADVSKLADAFRALYGGKDLKEFLGHLSSDSWNKIDEITKALK